MADNRDDRYVAPIHIPGSETPTPAVYYPRSHGHQQSQSVGQSWPDSQPSAMSSYFPPFSPRAPQRTRQASPGRPNAGRTSTGRANRSVSASAGTQHRTRRVTRSASLATTRSDASGDDRDVYVYDEDLENGPPDESPGEGEEEDQIQEQDPDELLDEIEAHTEDGDPVTLKERQSLINVEHPFGLPIWKPALYKKTRTVTRNAETAIHNVPTPERHITPGNIFWTAVFGWWLSCMCFAVAFVLTLVPFGGRRYAWVIWGLGWYIFWPFGKYVEGNLEEDVEVEREWSTVRDDGTAYARGGSGSESGRTIKGLRTANESLDEADEEDIDPDRTPQDGGLNAVLSAEHVDHRPSDVVVDPSSSWVPPPTERSPLLTNPLHDREASRTTSTSSSATPRPLASHGVPPRLDPPRVYGTIPARAPPVSYPPYASPNEFLGRLFYWILYPLFIAPFQLLVCLICFGLVLLIPMAKLNWAIVKLLLTRPLSIRFCSPPAVIVSSGQNGEADGSSAVAAVAAGKATIRPTRLRAGQAAPSGAPRSTVLLCTYRAAGWQYYKYTIGGVNIMFVNLLPIVFFVILDAFVLLPLQEHHPHNKLLAIIASRPLIFVLSLLSVIPLSYFIGMAVASISAQSSIGMGAVINASFGSIIEIILYGIALTQGKGLLVEGSIVGSLLAGVLLMPGASMCSGALRRKEQIFNAKSAGVTSTMLIMAIIGTLTPTLFYQTYGNFQLTCTGCPAELPEQPDQPWLCRQCYYEHPNPVTDPFYQETVKGLMYFCAAILLLSYLIGLWFSLRTHASQIWQNPQQLMHPLEVPQGTANPNTGRMLSMYHKLVNQQISKSPLPTHRTGNLSRKSSFTTTAGSVAGTQRPPSHHGPLWDGSGTINTPRGGPTSSPTTARRQTSASIANGGLGAGYGPLLETVNQAVKSSNNLQPMPLPPNLTTDDFTRAVAVATVSALRHQQGQSPARPRTAMGHHEGEGGHESPSWSRTFSGAVLVACTVLYAAIADVLVDVVDVVLEGSGLDEKFLGLTLFALVPNTTEFMNAMSFAMNGNIALSMEIGSAYALQVCLLQIPAMVGFSAWYDPRKFGNMADTFTLIFPRWDVIAIILSIFLLTYVYIEARSNYHRGSTLILSYLVLMLGFYFAPARPAGTNIVPGELIHILPNEMLQLPPTWAQHTKALLYSLWTR